MISSELLIFLKSGVSISDTEEARVPWLFRNVVQMNIEEEYQKRYASLLKKISYEVHPLGAGETIGLLARKYNVTEQQIYDANPGKNLKERATKLQLGEKINIPESALSFGNTLSGKPLSTQINEAAEWAGISPQVLAAMVDVESSGKARATSHKGAQGLGQLMPSIQKAFGITDPYDPAQNLPATAMWFAGLQKNAPGENEQEKVWHALMQYNWSPAKFNIWFHQSKDPKLVPQETRKHAKKVFDRLGWRVPNAYIAWYMPAITEVGISKPLR